MGRVRIVTKERADNHPHVRVAFDSYINDKNNSGYINTKYAGAVLTCRNEPTQPEFIRMYQDKRFHCYYIEGGGYTNPVLVEEVIDCVSVDMKRGILGELDP